MTGVFETFPDAHKLSQTHIVLLAHPTLQPMDALWDLTKYKFSQFCGYKCSFPDSVLFHHSFRFLVSFCLKCLLVKDIWNGFQTFAS